jgi:hypothetical protein
MALSSLELCSYPYIVSSKPVHHVPTMAPSETKGKRLKRTKNRPPDSSWFLLGSAGSLSPHFFQTKKTRASQSGLPLNVSQGSQAWLPLKGTWGSQAWFPLKGSFRSRALLKGPWAHKVAWLSPKTSPLDRASLPGPAWKPC